jgi:hypothetical protein
MDKIFTFFVSPYKYTVSFTGGTDPSLELSAEHHESYHSWSTTIYNNFAGSSSNSSGIINKLNPSLVYDVLFEFDDKTLDSSKIEIIFPEEVLTGDNLPIIFDFKTLVYKSTINDRITINLEFIETSKKDILSKKITANNLKTEEKMAKLESRIIALEALLVSTGETIKELKGMIDAKNA